MGAPVLLCLMAAVAQDPNLLINASFEDLAPDGRPIHWSAFVMPQDGAFADTDPLAVDGSRSALLHVPNSYDREPANNWSQIILADLGAKELRFRGMIRTEAAGEAALWLQCFTKTPARVAAAASSHAQAALTGTADWTPREVRLKAPPNTDFVVVRCVLKGQGTAWFDDLRLEIVPAVQPALAAFEPAPDPVEGTPGEATLVQPSFAELSRMLNQAIAELEANNSTILARIQRIQQELEQTRATAPEDLAPLQTRHPLVPHGWTAEPEPR